MSPRTREICSHIVFRPDVIHIVFRDICRLRTIVCDPEGLIVCRRIPVDTSDTLEKKRQVKPEPGGIEIYSILETWFVISYYLEVSGIVYRICAAADYPVTVTVDYFKVTSFPSSRKLGLKK